jgi:hypothetical protein
MSTGALAWTRGRALAGLAAGPASRLPVRRCPPACPLLRHSQPRLFGTQVNADPVAELRGLAVDGVKAQRCVELAHCLRPLRTP